jgi:hypothetical protein
MGKYKFSNSQRYVVWLTHNGCCFWCQEPMLYRDVTVDHIIPEYYIDRPEELSSIIELYGLPNDFDLNDFANWVPSHTKCNQRKSIKLFEVCPASLTILTRVLKKGITARKQHTKLLSDITNDKKLAILQMKLEKGDCTGDDLVEMMIRTRAVTLDRLEPTNHKDILNRLSPGWTISQMDGEYAVLTDGNRSGITPAWESPDASWQCPHCGSFGPWKGIICQSCGQRSMPD